MEKSKSFNVQKLVYASVFVALSVVINSLRIGSVSFGGFPIIFSGYVLGPIMGFIVGFVSDLVGFIVRPSSFGFNPLFALTSALTGAIPVIVTTKLLGDKYPEFKLWKILVGIFIGQTITSVILVPIFRVMLYGKNTFWFYMTSAAAKQAISIPIYAVLMKIVWDRIKGFVKL